MDRQQEPEVPVTALPDNLVAELKSRNHQRRAAACAELGRHLERGAIEAIEVLIPCLTDPHPQVREAAADALTRGPADRVERAVLTVIEALSPTAPPIRRAMLLHVLGLLDRPCEGELCETLVSATAHADADVRFQAVSSLNLLECESDEFRASLRRLLRDTDDEVAAVAATAVANFGRVKLLPLILERWRVARGFAKRHLALAAAYLGAEETLPTLEMAVRSGIDGLDAIEAMLSLGTEPAVEMLRWAARSFRVHPVIRARAGVALAELDTEDAPAIVAKHLKSRRTELRCGTMEWLGRQQLASFLPRLVGVLAEPTSRDSAVAAYSLGFMGSDEALEPLRRAASSDPRADVREEAESAIARLESTTAVR